MRFDENEEFLGFPILFAKQIVCLVDDWPMASEGWLAAKLGVELEILQILARRLEAEMFLVESGWPPESHDCRILPTESPSRDKTRFWHLGDSWKRLVKAVLGPHLIEMLRMPSSKKH